MKTIATAILGSLAIGSVSAILGGKVVPPHESNYTSFLSLSKSGDPICGAALINPRHVLTSASCTLQKPTYVVVGAQSLSNTSSADVLKIKKTQIHPKYDAQYLAYDLAVLTLEKKSSFTPANLPATEDSSQTIKAKDLAFALGWGSTNWELYYELSEKLYSVELPVIENGACRNLTGLSFINRQYLCAGGLKDKGLNRVDLGGPLIAKNKPSKGKDMVVGVASYAQSGHDGEISIFARVSAELDWIRSQLQ